MEHDPMFRKDSSSDQGISGPGVAADYDSNYENPPPSHNPNLFPSGTNPTNGPFADSTAASHAGSLSEGAKIGLGVGLGVGLFVCLVLATLICCCLFRRRRRRRGNRLGKNNRDVGSETAMIENPSRAMEATAATTVAAGALPVRNKEHGAEHDEHAYEAVDREITDEPQVQPQNPFDPSVDHDTMHNAFDNNVVRPPTPEYHVFEPADRAEPPASLETPRSTTARSPPTRGVPVLTIPESDIHSAITTPATGGSPVSALSLSPVSPIAEDQRAPTPPPQRGRQSVFKEEGSL